MNNTPVPRFRRQFMPAPGICACVVTSSAVVGLSAIRSASARAPLRSSPAVAARPRASVRIGGDDPVRVRRGASASTISPHATPLRVPQGDRGRRHLPRSGRRSASPVECSHRLLEDHRPGCQRSSRNHDGLAVCSTSSPSTSTAPGNRSALGRRPSVYAITLLPEPDSPTRHTDLAGAARQGFASRIGVVPLGARRQRRHRCGCRARADHRARFPVRGSEHRARRLAPGC